MAITPLVHQRIPPAVTSESALVALRGASDGVGYSADRVEAWVKAGKVFAASLPAGTPATAATFKTAVDEDQPILVVDVAAGKAIIPLYFKVAMKTAGATPEVQLWTATAGLAGGTATAVTPVNLNGASSSASSCTVSSLYSVNMTAAPTLAILVTAHEFDSDALFVPFEWSRKLAGVAPVVYTPAGTAAASRRGLVAHVSAGTGCTGYLSLIWVEDDAGSLGIY